MSSDRLTSFVAGEQPWIERLGNLRNVVRQEVIARQIAPLASPGTTVLDVGCGQGTQALRLASSDCKVTAVDPSSELLAMCSESARARGLDVELLPGRIEDLGEVCRGLTFELVLCHGVMMYLDNWAQAVGDLGERLKTGGHLSITFRNGHALAMRPGLRGDWATALSAFDSTAYVNELGLPALASRAVDIEAALASAGLRPVTWYGVRVLTDAVAADVLPPDPETLEILLQAEERAGSAEPYKWMASQLHVIATPAA
jgi:S-adenosylmethionine-dependent methyltransferase